MLVKKAKHVLKKLLCPTISSIDGSSFHMLCARLYPDTLNDGGLGGSEPEIPTKKSWQQKANIFAYSSKYIKIIQLQSSPEIKPSSANEQWRISGKSVA